MSQPTDNSNPSSSAASLVSPVPFAGSTNGSEASHLRGNLPSVEEPNPNLSAPEQNRLQRQLFQQSQAPGASSADGFPSNLICSITQEPPVRGYRFNVPLPDGTVSDLAFEYSALIRHISTQGHARSHRSVRHPIISEYVRRDQALSLIVPVSTQEQNLMNHERQRLGLGTEESNPLTQDDWRRYNDMIESVRDP